MPESDPDRPSPPPEFRDALERAAEELFIGRARELGQLDSALNDAIGGRGRMLLIAGEPGIGKTRLAEQVAARASDRGAEVHWGRCWEGEGAPAFWPWVQVTRSHLRGCDANTLAAELGIGASYVAQVVPELREILPDVPPAPPLDSEQARFRLYDSFSAFLRNAAARTPVVVVLDDLQWADKSSLLLLRFLAREIRDARLFLVATYRDVEVSVDHSLADTLASLRRERTVERILLRGLSEDDVRAMVAALRGGTVAEAFAASLARETAGNPFFIKEVVRHLVEESLARREGGRSEAPVDEREIRLPESVREVVGRRLARLAERCRKVLTVASVVGQEFEIGLLERAADLPAEPLIEALEEAVSARVVETVPETIGRYRFSHTLVRETLYQGLHTLDRVRLHGRVGDALERLSPHDRERWGELAHHFLAALPGGDVARAVDCAVRAGDHAAERLAYEEAAILYGRALQALELVDSPDERLRCELLLKRGEAQWNAGGFENPGEVFREAAELAKGLGAAELLGRAALGMGGPGAAYAIGGWLMNEVDVGFLQAALAALEETDTALRARLMARLGGVTYLFLREPERAAAMGREAIEMARRVGDAQTLGFVLNSTNWATGRPDRCEERRALTDETIRLAEATGNTTVAVEAYLWRALHHLELGDVEAADRDLESQTRLAASSRQPYLRHLAAAARSGRAFLEGRFADAEIHRSEATTAASEAWGAASAELMWSDGATGQFFHEHQGTIREEEIAAWENLLALAPVPIYRRRVARLLLDRGRIEAAREHFEVLATRDFSDVPMNNTWLWMMQGLALLASSLGDRPRAKILHDLLLPYGDRCPVAGAMLCTGSLWREVGLLATTLGRFDDAEKHFEKALETNGRIRAVVWLAHTRHDYGRMLCRRAAPGDREKAADLVGNALATAREIGLRPLEQAVVATLTETGLAATEKREVAATPAPPNQFVFRKEGDLWTIAYETAALRLKDSKGLQYIAELLRREGEEIHAADLASRGTGGETPRGDAGEILDPQARAEYRQRLRDLEAELEEATRWSDVGRAARIQEEIEFLKDELSAAFGVGGRARKAGDTTERARKAVASRIRDAIEKISREHRALALHLENAIRTGAFCCYRPDRAPGWKL